MAIGQNATVDFIASYRGSVIRKNGLLNIS
jgi:hypothetical protein